MFTLLSSAYLLALMASVFAALAGWTALAARRRFRSGPRWAALSVVSALIGAAAGGSRMYTLLSHREGSLPIAIVMLPIIGTVIGGLVPLVTVSRLRRIEPPPARGSHWPIFVIAGLEAGDQRAELTLEGGAMEITGAARRFVIPLTDIARVTIDVTTIVIERASAEPAIRICPALDDEAGPLPLRTAALRLHKRLAAEVAARRPEAPPGT